MTDTDRIEELISDIKNGLAKEIALRDGEPDNEWREVNVLKLDNQIQFLRSLSTTIKDLEEKAEALDSIMASAVLRRIIFNHYRADKIQFGHVIPPYLQNRLGKEG